MHPASESMSSTTASLRASAPAAPTGVPASSGSPDPLATLRAATQAHHEALDRSLPLARDDATLADYAAHLQRLRPWLRALRPALVAAGVGELDAVARRLNTKLDALDADLAEPGVDGLTQRPDLLPNPSPDEAPSPAQAWCDAARAQPGFAWGLAYVVEGSQLGGVVLYRRLGARLAPHPMRYLAGVGRDTGEAWQAFLVSLRAALGADPAARTAAERGALAAFEALMPDLALAPTLRAGAHAPVSRTL